MIKYVLFLILLSTLISSCKKDQIKTYILPKEVIPVVNLQKSLKLSWSFPLSWEKTTVNKIRKESYAVPITPEINGDFSIISFPGEAGGILQNVNRWRGQLGLSNITEADLLEVSKKITHNSLNILFFNMESSPKHNQTQFKQILVATFLFNQERYFIKLTSPKIIPQEIHSQFIAIIENTHAN